ncbi:hypothetical protein BT96DRAFT_110069 [Gymnopus androsaceus JB14]|uniref:Uncharacterized protein n=1 Tax=Gymnopus androsaceus JB14 TaxID=1447944 RepID=A0A6A4HFD0_9AGAR|nr:hypothetical protein BT96DRAFT_110069 [Gymnopus androsaceus JB14]
MPRGSGDLFSFSMSTNSTDVISSLSLPPDIPASMQSSGRGLSSANTSRSAAFNHRDGGVSEGNEATAKEEVNTPPPNQHEVLQNFFQSLLTSKQTGGTENKDPSLRTSALDPGKIQRTVGSSSSIYYDDDRARSSFGSPTLPTEMYSGEPSTLIPSEG